MVEYRYTVEDCDVPASRRSRLRRYREFRSKLLDSLVSESDTAISSQIHSLGWHTAVFRTMNEARRLEPRRAVNGAMWELITIGYATVMALGIRKLVDADGRADSIRYVISQLRKHPEFLTRELYVCFDGLSYDYEAAKLRVADKMDWSQPNWMPRYGPDAYDSSEMLHESFDRLSLRAASRRRLDTIDQSLLDRVDKSLSNPVIKKVVNFTDKVIAHAERIAEGKSKIPIPTYSDMDNALKIVTRIASFIAGTIFYETSITTVVPAPQFNVMEHMDDPWVKSKNIPALQNFWQQFCDGFDADVKDFDRDFLPLSKS